MDIQDFDAFPFERKPLPVHPNIVDMQAVFTDQVPEAEGAMESFPDALPAR